MASGKKLDIYKITGTGYERGWWTNNHCRYRVFAGARNTKKSYDILGVEVLDKIMSDPRRNVLILRQIGGSNRYSTFSTLDMLINQPDPAQPEVSLSRYFHINRGGLTIEYKPTGQLILFDGMLNPTKLTSTRMPRGYLTDVYVEEAYELPDFDAWRRVDGTIRGKLPQGCFHQITFCMNPWNKSHWIYEHFFKGRLEDDLDYLLSHDYQDYNDPGLIIDYGKGLYLHKSTYKINEFRDREIYDAAMEEMRAKAPEIYKVEALGMWGMSTDRTYFEMNDSLIKGANEINSLRFAGYCIGIDFGVSDGQGNIKKIKIGKNGKPSKSYESATTMQLAGITSDYGCLAAIDEYFHSNDGQLIKKTGPELQRELVSTIKQWRDVVYASHPDLMKGTIPVYVDSADAGGFRQGLELEARRQGLFGVVFQGSTKIRIDSRVYFSRHLMAYGECLFSRNCPNLIREVQNARKGDDGSPRDDFDDHAINAWEYAWAPMRERIRRWKTFKEH